MSYQGYFIYKGVAYGVGTKVLLSNKTKFSAYNIPRGKTIDEIRKMPHTFKWGSTNGEFHFYWHEKDNDRLCNRYCNSYAKVTTPDEEIEKIVEPIYVKLVSWQEKAFDNMMNKTVSPDIFGWVLLYVVAMLVGALFYARVLIWVFATVVFVFWLLSQYRT